MTAKRETASLEPRVTIEDLKHRAEDVKSKAVAQAKGAVDTVVGESGERTLLVVVGIVVVAASLAYFLGMRSARESAYADLLGE